MTKNYTDLNFPPKLQGKFWNGFSASLFWFLTWFSYGKYIKIVHVLEEVSVIWRYFSMGPTTLVNENLFLKITKSFWSRTFTLKPDFWRCLDCMQHIKVGLPFNSTLRPEYCFAFLIFLKLAKIMRDKMLSFCFA